MAKEMIREGKVEPVASPDTPLPSDQRDYLFAEVKKATAYAAPPALGSYVGTALAVKLKGDDRWYTSNHGMPDSSIQRDDPAATTIELPPGANQGSVEAIEALAVPVGAPGDYAITVTALNRGFFLGKTFAPHPSFLRVVRQRGADAAAPGRDRLARDLLVDASSSTTDSGGPSSPLPGC